MKRIYAIDFIRWVLALAIVYFHVLHASIIPYVPKESVYLHLRELSDYAAVIVECFFILSGFFFAKTFCRHSDFTMYDFAKHRFTRLWPVLAFYFIVMFFFFGGKFYQTVYNLAFLQCIGLTASMHGITWYISSGGRIRRGIACIGESFGGDGHGNFDLRMEPCNARETGRRLYAFDVVSCLLVDRTVVHCAACD